MTFEQFVSLRGGALLRFAAVLTGDRGTAEDVVQEALVRAHRRWHRIEPLEQPEAYVRRMIINEYLSWRRRWSRQVPVDQPNPPPSDAPDHATAYVERAAIAADLARLPRQQRAVLVLRYYAGFTDAEIAEALSCTPGTVRGYASRALAALRIVHAPALTERG